ncbi:ATP-binding cassette domain-containing protein [Candidatus Bathyarchaeota archaeon]|nr:ATP-binding cassette domain-containing protein [Candidatus Bathyarchaeota archaeon]
MEEVITTQGLTKKYKEVCAVENLNLKVKSGEIFGFLGPNGAGKTTTIRVLTTLTKPTSGTAWVTGFDVSKEPDKVKKVIGVVQQHLSLDQDLTVKENMDFHGRLHHMNSAERKQRIVELLDYVGLTKQGDRNVKELSGGMRKAAMIARSLMNRPKVLFLDEPTVGLEVQTRRRMWELIRRLNSDGTSIFLTTHYIEEAEALCQRVGIIHQGRLIALGAPLELRSKVGLVTVETLVEGKFTRYQYFPNREAATNYVQNLPSEVKTIIIRDSNLEDIFVELTGHKVGETE